MGATSIKSFLIGSHTVSGPSGIVASYPDEYFQYLSQWKDFWLRIPETPSPGKYPFTVASCDLVGSDTDIQTKIIDLPNPDANAFTPVDGALLETMTLTFSCPAIEYSVPSVDIYYRIVINIPGVRRAYATGHELDMTSHQVPPNYLEHHYFTPLIYPFPLDNYLNEGAYQQIAVDQVPMETTGCGWDQCYDTSYSSPLNIDDSEAVPPYLERPDGTVEFNQIVFDSN